MKPVNSQHVLLQFCFLGYLLLLLKLTLFTHNYYTYGRSNNLHLFASIRLMLASRNPLLIAKNIAGNVVLFVPFGVLFPLVLVRQRIFLKAMAGAFALSFIIENAQYFFAARIFDIDDLLLNMSGAFIGCLLLWVYRCRRKIIFHIH
ncbi:MAG: VanZ family protein [Sporolactobacillus sp.]